MSHLYVFQADDGPVKIGISENPVKRARELELSMGRAITRRFVSGSIADPRTVEIALHRHFVGRRAVGEWFLVSFGEAVSAAQALLAPIETLDGARSAEVTRAAELAGRYAALKASGIGGEAALAGFAAVLTDDDLQALAVTVRAAGLEMLQACEVIADALDITTAARVRDLLAASNFAEVAAEVAVRLSETRPES